MRKTFALSFLVSLLAVPSVFAALTVSTEGLPGGYGPYQTGVGGEFTLQISDPNLINSGYFTGAPLSPGQPGTGTRNVLGGTDVSFQTFCVEGREYIYPNATYTVAYNNHSVYTDIALTRGAAYLYSQFATGGNFGGNATYNYGAGRSTSAGLLQNAIWALMGGQEGQTEANNSSNPFLLAAEAQFGGTFAGANGTADTGFDSVYVLNMWDSGGRAAQDQLIYTPGAIPNVVPDGGMTAVLLGLGLTGLGFVSRRIRR